MGARLRQSGRAYALLGPGLLWLALFFLVPLGYMADVALQEGNIDEGFTRALAFGNFTNALSDFSAQFIRSFQYAGIATGLCLLIGYPLAYAIAFRGGRWRNALLLAVIAPFFVTYLIRTQSWQTILDDDGFVVDVLRLVGLVGDDGRVLATSAAVIAGITYNFLPFMILPIYASLERMDSRMLEAGYDLYGRRRDVFARVTLPMSMPGVVAGVLLTFIPAAGDFINARLLGTPEQYMIGNVIQSRYLDLADYPTAAALSFLLMALMLLLVLVWARAAGTESLMGAEAR